MKTIALLVALGAIASLPSRADDPKGAQTLMETQTTAKEKAAKPVPVTPPKPANQILGKRVIYGGYFSDFLKAENKRALFNLKAPIDPQKDLENVWFYPGTQKPQGTVLFSIKF